MSCLLDYKKIKTKKIYKEVNGKFMNYYKLLDVDTCEKIECNLAYSFDSRISYQYIKNKKHVDYKITNIN